MKTSFTHTNIWWAPTSAEARRNAINGDRHTVVVSCHQARWRGRRFVKPRVFDGVTYIPWRITTRSY